MSALPPSDPAAPTRMRDQIRAMPRQIWILYGAAFINRLGTFVFPFLALYLSERGEPPTVVGLAVSAYALGALPARLAGGVVADRLGRRTTMVLSMTGAALATLGIWRADSVPAIFACVVALGLLGDMAQPASKALITDLVPPPLRPTAFSLWRVATNAGWAGGLALGGLLATRSFDLMFIGDAATSLLFAALALAFLPQGTRSRRADEVHLPSVPRAILADRGFLVFLLATFLGGLVYSQNVAVLPLRVRDVGLGPAVYGSLQSLNGLLVMTVEVAVVAYVRRFPRPRVIATGHLLTGLAFASLAFAQTVPALVAMVTIWTLGEMTQRPVSTAAVADRAPVHARGRYQAAEDASLGASLLIGPLVGTALYGWSPAVLWTACGAVGALAGLAALRYGRHPVPVGTWDGPGGPGSSG